MSYLFFSILTISTYNKTTANKPPKITWLGECIPNCILDIPIKPTIVNIIIRLL